MQGESVKRIFMSDPKESEQTPAMRQYLEIKRQHADCLLFYRMGDFFELFFEDAVIASKELEIALTKRGKKSDGSDIPMCGVPAHAYELYLTKLIQKGFKVAICDQTETPEQARQRGARGPLQRMVVRIVTRGTLTEDNLLTSSHNYLLAISPIRKTNSSLSVAIADISTGFFGVETIPDEELFNTITRWDPAEIVMADSTFSEFSHLPNWEVWKPRLTLLPKLRFDVTNAEHLLKSVYDVTTLDVFGKMQTSELQAAGVLVDYVMMTQCCRTITLSPPKILQTKEFLAIDAATRRNLELVSSSSATGSGTLLHVLDKAVTAVGKRLLKERLSAPLLHIPAIEHRLDQVQFFVQNMALCQQLREALAKTQDLERIISRLTLGRASPRDLGALRNTLQKVVLLQQLLTAPEASAWWQDALSGHDALLQMLENALMLELPVFVHQGGFIAVGFDAVLDEARRLKEHADETLQELQNKYAQETGINNLRIRRNNVWGIYIEVSAAQTTKVPFSFVHRQTLTNCTRYTTEELAALEKSINSAETTVLARETELFQELCADVLRQAASLIALSNAIAEIDMASMSAFLAHEYHYTRPTFTEDTSLEICNGRHPVVEMSNKQIGQNFCGNDCTLSKKQRRFLLVTGPNMAGKSTFLRQNAILIIMAQMGMFIPADSAKIGITDRIFSRIGAADDLAYGRSTFMVEMIETASILHQATERSFVILDEIGRGTATYDGLAIAWSVSEYLYQHIQCRTLFATHYHELIQLAEQCKAMCPVTADVKEWEGKIIFLHRMIDGFAQRSYGIHVAQLAGLPKAVILRAQELLHTFEKTGQPLVVPKEKVKSSLKPESQNVLF